VVINGDEGGVPDVLNSARERGIVQALGWP